MFLPSETSGASFAVAFVVAPVASPAVVGEAGLKKRKIGYFDSGRPPAAFPGVLAGDVLVFWLFFPTEDSLLSLSLKL